jgi:hypothetical protein
VRKQAREKLRGAELRGEAVKNLNFLKNKKLLTKRRDFVKIRYAVIKITNKAGYICYAYAANPFLKWVYP